jgi:hypothetical protein
MTAPEPLADVLRARQMRSFLAREDGYSFRPTSEADLVPWTPTFHGCVGIVITEPVPEHVAAAVGALPGSCRVVVCGADDMSMARACASLDEARGIVLALPSIIERAALVARGFEEEP